MQEAKDKHQNTCMHGINFCRTIDEVHKTVQLWKLVKNGKSGQKTGMNMIQTLNKSKSSSEMPGNMASFSKNKH